MSERERHEFNAAVLNVQFNLAAARGLNTNAQIDLPIVIAGGGCNHRAQSQKSIALNDTRRGLGIESGQSTKRRCHPGQIHGQREHALRLQSIQGHQSQF